MSETRDLAAIYDLDPEEVRRAIASMARALWSALEEASYDLSWFDAPLTRTLAEIAGGAE